MINTVCWSSNIEKKKKKHEKMDQTNTSTREMKKKCNLQPFSFEFSSYFSDIKCDILFPLIEFALFKAFNDFL